MPNFIIDWDVVGGESAAMIIDAPTRDEALEYARGKWLQAAEKQDTRLWPADYDAQPYSDELAEERGLQTLL